MATATDSGIHATTHGDGPPMVFLHGAWVSEDMWEPQRDRFARDHTVITVDIRGHGRSGPTETENYSIDLFTDDLRELLVEFGVDAPVLCGLSLGGLIAQSYTLKYGNVPGLILADTVRSVPPIPITRWQKRLFFPKLPLYSTINAVGSDSWFRMLLCGIERLYGRPWLALDGSARQYALKEVSALSDREFIKIYDALYDFDPLPVSDIDTPTLLLTGDHETPTVRAQNHSLQSHIDGATHAAIPNAGHLANLDNPRVFNRSIASFLARIGA